MIIAIIDDGVSTASTPNLLFSLHVNAHGLIRTFKGYIDPLGHGSICSAIIQKYSPYAQIGSIKILDSNTKKGDCFKLKKAIFWCIEHNVKIIHLSLGTVSASDYSSLLNIINQAYENGIIIISACKNGSNFSYPATFSNVIGVQCDPQLQGDAYYAKTPNYHGIDFFSSASHELKELQSTPYQGLTPVCNSYAAPVITAKIYAILLKHPYKNFDQIKEDLNKSSKLFNPQYFPRLYKQLDWITTLKMLVIGNLLVPSNYIRQCKIDEIIYLESDLEIKNTLNASANLPVAFYSTHILDTKNIITENIPPIIFLKKSNMHCFQNTPNRIFVPTILDDYAVKTSLPNERPVIAILQDINNTELSISAVLKEMFKTHNFNILFFSEYSIDILLGAVYIDTPLLYQHHCIKMADQLDTELLIVHLNFKNLQALNPDIIICNTTTAKFISYKEVEHTPIILTDHHDYSELFKAICDIVCE
ncbi:S8 family serine peptidase [Clostridium sp. HBUAS56010]|uniref:S8 family serine peptidase n=1 Tax=Clostridium sp. HBUAS56010 TaxID=2571127 RepID=UPI00163D8913|nr:S8 family serine peptidase [Clostridium sp. HBUAS56010]